MTFQLNVTQGKDILLSFPRWLAKIIYSGNFSIKLITSGTGAGEKTGDVVSKIVGIAKRTWTAEPIPEGPVGLILLPLNRISVSY